jgi:6-phosphogluconolactonase
MTNPTLPNPDDPAVAGPRINRRSFVAGAAALSVSAALPGSKLLAASTPPQASQRILVGSGTPNGILSFAWDASTGTLTPEGIAAVVSHSTWLHISPDRRFLYVACELDEFEGKPTGSVASFRMPDPKLDAKAGGKLKLISNVASQGRGTCHLTTDRAGYIVIAANYMGGSAASFLATDGKLGEAVWNEHYMGYPGHGPVADRQEAAHAHFASLSPDNRFVYVNDLGADKIHIYRLDADTGILSPSGTYLAKPGDGPRTLHFHAGGKVAYCVNELNSTVTVLHWSAADGSLSPIQTVTLLPEGTAPKHGAVTNTGCDTVLTRDGRFAYFANRGDDFLMSFHIEPATGKLTPFAKSTRTSCGGKTPRNFTLDPTERWMLVANQNSSNLSVFARDPETGVLANDGRNFAAATPMCIVFV